jgi:hypothetical protein
MEKEKIVPAPVSQSLPSWIAGRQQRTLPHLPLPGDGDTDLASARILHVGSISPRILRGVLK